MKDPFGDVFVSGVERCTLALDGSSDFSGVFGADCPTLVGFGIFATGLLEDVPLMLNKCAFKFSPSYLAPDDSGWDSIDESYVVVPTGGTPQEIYRTTSPALSAVVGIRIPTISVSQGAYDGMNNPMIGYWNLRLNLSINGGTAAAEAAYVLLKAFSQKMDNSKAFDDYGSMILSPYKLNSAPIS